jgi:hypothetical protein
MINSINRYFDDISSLTNESAKVSLFMSLVSNLVPNASVKREMYRGLEKRLRLEEAGVSLSRRADLLHGNAVIEFENDLRRTQKTAYKQLQEYSAAVIQKNPGIEATLLAIASDGIRWVTYRIHNKALNLANPSWKEIELIEISSREFNKKRAHEFLLYLHSHLLRIGYVKPDAENINQEFGPGAPTQHSFFSIFNSEFPNIVKNSEVAIAYETWKSFTTLAYGEIPGNPEHFYCAQLYLNAFAKIFTWACIEKGNLSNKGLAADIKFALDGKYFTKFNITNLDEADFFSWLSNDQFFPLFVIALERIGAQILEYDVANVQTDVFKLIYQDLVALEHREKLGEYYTPQWLCEYICEPIIEANPEAKILDPSCGSGGFLYAAISQKLRTKNKRNIKSIIDEVCGFDVNPLAVAISKANLLIAFSKELSGLTDPISLPVYLCNSLFYPELPKQLSLDSSSYATFKTDVGIEFHINERILHRTDHFDNILECADDVAHSIALGHKEDKDAMSNYLRKAFPDLYQGSDFDEIVDGCWTLAQEMATSIKQGKDGIWKYVLKNSHRPWLMRNKFDYVVGNPPWTVLRKLSSRHYQERVKSLTEDRYELCKAGNLTPLFELATLFVAHCIDSSLKSDGELHMVLPRSIFNGDQHHRLRMQEHTVDFTVEAIVDLKGVAPLFKVPSCYLVAKKNSKIWGERLKVSASILEGKLPGRDVSLSIAKSHLTMKPILLETQFLGSASALCEAGLASKAPVAPSPYLPLFREGATLVPLTFYLVDIAGNPTSLLDSDTYLCNTSDRISSIAKTFKTFQISGRFTGRFIWRTFLAENLAPFRVVGGSFILLPFELTGDGPKLVSHNAMMKLGYRNEAKHFERAFTTYEDAKQKLNIYQRLDFQRGLSGQKRFKFYCVYNHSGTNLCAAKLKGSDYQWVIYAKLYWFGTDNEEEADYLVGILNSNKVNLTIKPFQSFGALGERDIHRLPLQLPIPKFDSLNERHALVATLSNSISNIACNATLVSVKNVNELRKQLSVLVEPFMPELEKAVRNVI